MRCPRRVRSAMLNTECQEQTENSNHALDRDEIKFFQKTVLVGARHHGRLLVRHAYSFHQSSEEAGDFLAHADLQRRNSEYLAENALHLHLIVKPVYHTLIRTPK